MDGASVMARAKALEEDARRRPHVAGACLRWILLAERTARAAGLELLAESLRDRAGAVRSIISEERMNEWRNRT